MDMKRCHDCEEEKPRIAFSKNLARKDGLDHLCRSCRSLRWPSKKRALERLPLELPIEHLAYLAGLLDGEGSIRLRGTPIQMHVEVTITNTHLPVLQWVKDVTKIGNIVVHSKRRSPRHKPTWRWVVGAINARRLLRALLPFLHIKLRHAELILAFYKAVPAYKEKHPGALVPPFADPNLQAFLDELRALNRRG